MRWITISTDPNSSVPLESRKPWELSTTVLRRGVPPPMNYMSKKSLGDESGILGWSWPRSWNLYIKPYLLQNYHALQLYWPSDLMSVCSGSLGFTSPIWILNVHSEYFSGSIDTLIRGPLLAGSSPPNLCIQRKQSWTKTVVWQVDYPNRSCVCLHAVLLSCFQRSIISKAPGRRCRFFVNPRPRIYHLAGSWKIVTDRRPFGIHSIGNCPCALIFKSFWPMAIPFIAAHDVCFQCLHLSTGTY